MNRSILLLAMLCGACAPRYALQTPPEDAPQPISIGGKSLVAISRDGRHFVWYAKPEDVVVALLRQASAGMKADADALAAETKAHEKCEKDRGALAPAPVTSSSDSVKTPATGTKP